MRTHFFHSSLPLLMVVGLASAAQGMVVAEFLPATRSQGNGIGGTNWLSQTFIPDATDTLATVETIVERGYASVTAPLTVEIRDVQPGSDRPGSNILGSVTYAASEIPYYTSSAPFNDPPESVLTSFDFTGENIGLVAGVEYAMVLHAAAGGTADYYVYLTTNSNPAPNVNYSPSQDGGVTWNEFGLNFDAAYRVSAIPEASPVLAFLLIGGAIAARRGRKDQELPS